MKKDYLEIAETRLISTELPCDLCGRVDVNFLIRWVGEVIFCHKCRKLIPLIEEDLQKRGYSPKTNQNR